MTKLVILLCALSLFAADAPLIETQILFPPEKWHNHSSSITELPNGDLFVAWFHGSGERTADDVVILGSRWVQHRKAWTKPMLLADNPGFPDTNPVVYLDSKNRLWLFWAQIIANEWHTALTRYVRATDFSNPDSPPKWDWSGNVVLIPRNIATKTKEIFPNQEKLNTLAADKYFSRMGWFTRTHPLELASGRMLLPMYSDGYSYGIMGISDDGGASWSGSEPIIGGSGIQPSVVVKKDGTLVAYLRDNGPAPKRAQIATSSDNGLSWTAAIDTETPNPGSSLEVIKLRSGEWVMVGNDTEKNRDRLRIAISEDEGTTWKWSRYLENDTDGRFHYPSIIQARDGSIHVTYSVFMKTPDGEQKTIKHARLNTAWVKVSPSVRP